MKTRGTAALAALVVALLTFFYVWPGVSRYTYGNYQSRVDRLTGQVQEWREGSRLYCSPDVKVAKDHWHGSEPCSLCKPYKPLSQPAVEFPKRPSRVPLIPGTLLPVPAAMPQSSRRPPTATVHIPQVNMDEFEQAQRELDDFRKSLGPIPTGPFEPSGK